MSATHSCMREHMGTVHGARAQNALYALICANLYSKLLLLLNHNAKPRELQLFHLPQGFQRQAGSLSRPLAAVVALGDRALCRVLGFAEEFGISVSYAPLVLGERRGG